MSRSPDSAPPCAARTRGAPNEPRERVSPHTGLRGPTRSRRKQSVFCSVKAHCEAIYLQGSRARSKRTRPKPHTSTDSTHHTVPYVYDHVALGSHYCSASQRVGRFAHAPASVAEGRRTRRTKPSTTLPQSAPHHVRKAGLVRALGHGGGRILFRHSARTTPRGSGCKQRCLAGMNAWRARVIPTLWPRPPRRQHGTAAVEIRCGDSALRSVLWLGRIACRMQTAGLCACVCVRVRACVCARRRWRGRGATMPQVAGRQALPALSLRQRAFEILLGLVL